MKQVRDNEGVRITHYTGEHVNTFESLEDYVNQSIQNLHKIKEKVIERATSGIYNANHELKKMKHFYRYPRNNNYENLTPMLQVENLKDATGLIMVDTDKFKPTERERSATTNIRLNRYSLDGVKQSDSLDILVRPDNAGLAIYERLIKKVEDSRYAIANLKNHEMERLLELISYSKNELNYPSIRGKEAERVEEGRRNKLAAFLERYEDIESKKLILSSDLEETIDHMKSGLTTLKEDGKTIPEAAKMLKEFLNKHKSEVIISTGTKDEDLQVLRQHLRGKFKEELQEKRVFDIETVADNLMINKKDVGEEAGKLYKLVEDGKKNSTLSEEETVGSILKAKDGIVKKKESILSKIHPTKEVSAEEIAKVEALSHLEKGAYYKPTKELVANESDVSIAVKRKRDSMEIRSLKKDSRLNHEKGNLLRFYGLYDMTDITEEGEVKMLGAKLFNMATREDVYIIKRGENRFEEMGETVMELFSDSRVEGIYEREEVRNLSGLQMKHQQPEKDFGERIIKKYEGPNTQAGAYTLRSFEAFKESKEFIALDIETMGDTSLKEGTFFDITEIAAAEYDKEGNRVGQPFSRLARPSDRRINHIERMIMQFKEDPTALNTFSESDKRTFVDVMRYSTLEEGGVGAFKIADGEVIHNTLVEDVLTVDGKIDYGRVLDKPTYYELHVRSGLESLKNLDYSQKELAHDILDYLNARKDQLLLTYNGMNFDMPLLNDFVYRHIGSEIPGLQHLDLYQLLNTTNPAKEVMDSVYETDVKDHRLQTLASGLDMEGSKHSAIGDTDTLAKVASRIEDAIDPIVDGMKEIKVNRKEVRTQKQRRIEMMHKDAHVIDNREVEIGDTYRVKKAYKAFRENDESFIAFINPETKE